MSGEEQENFQGRIGWNPMSNSFWSVDDAPQRVNEEDIVHRGVILQGNALMATDIIVGTLDRELV